MDGLPERRLIALVRESQWQIDELGQVWRTCVRKGKKGGGSHLVPCDRRRAEKRTSQGYLMVRAMVDGERIHAMAHRLVWQHINGDIPAGFDINHRNGIKDDNRPRNLECCSPSSNSVHAHASGLLDQHGQNNPAAKLKDNHVAQIRLAYSHGGFTMKEIAARFGVSFQHVSKIVRGQRRPKQGGPKTEKDCRRSVCDRDEATGRLIGKKRAGRLLDGVQHDGYPS
mgnify:FL=1